MFCLQCPSLTRESLFLVSGTRILQSGCHIGESVAFALFTTCVLAIGDLAIGCLGVHAIETLDVRVATIFMKRMKKKKVVINKSSNSDSSILILLAVLHRRVFASFSRSSE